MSVRYISGSGITGTAIARRLRKGNCSAQVRTRRLANGFKVSYRNDYELEIIYDDIFAKNVYFLRPRTLSPILLTAEDVLALQSYFKSLYPRARIVTFEPNPETFFLLRENIVQNNLSGVRAINIAVSREDTEDAILYVGKISLRRGTLQTQPSLICGLTWISIEVFTPGRRDFRHI